MYDGSLICLLQSSQLVHLSIKCRCRLCFECRRSLDEAEVAKSKVSEKLLDAQHEVLHLKSSLEVRAVLRCCMEPAYRQVECAL